MPSVARLLGEKKASSGSLSRLYEKRCHVFLVVCMPNRLSVGVLLVESVALVRVRVEGHLACSQLLGRLAGVLSGGVTELLLLKRSQPVLTGSDGTKQQGRSHGEQGGVLQVGIPHLSSSRLENHGRGSKTALGSNGPEEIEVAPGLVDRLGVLVVVVVGGGRDSGKSVGIGVKASLDHESVKRSTGHETNTGTPGDSQGSDDN